MFVTFIIGRVVPIDPVLAIVGERASEAQIAAMRAELLINGPLANYFCEIVAQSMEAA